VDEKTAAKILGVSCDTLRRLRIRGEGPPRLQLSPRRVGYRFSSLSKYLDELDERTRKAEASR
jgi:hypothetical protein